MAAKRLNENNTQNTEKKVFRLGIDCRLAGNRHAGIGRYIQQLAVKVPFVVSKWHIVFTIFDEEQQKAIKEEWQRLGKNPKNISFVVAPIKHYTLAEQLKMPSVFNAQNLDLLHVPHFNIPLLYRGKIVVTIHDLLWHEYKGSEVTTLPKWVYWFKYMGYRWVVSTALSRSAAILVPSHTIKDTLTHHFPFTSKKIFVTYEGANQFHELRTTTKNKKPELSWNKNLRRLLYVGSLYPHKNISVVLQALQLDPTYTLDLVGSRSVFHDRVKAEITARGIEERVNWHGYLTDAELAHLSTQVTALIQPSLSEGFGLTGLEAMTQGTPLLASDIPIFREIFQDGAWYFDPKNPQSLVAILTTMTPSKVQTKLELAMARANTFSWQRMAEETASIYEHVTEL